MDYIITLTIKHPEETEKKRLKRNNYKTRAMPFPLSINANYHLETAPGLQSNGDTEFVVPLQQKLFVFQGLY